MSVKFLEELAERRRFGMRPGLETITRLCAALGDPQKKFPSVHVAGTNGKGAVCAVLDSCIRAAGHGRCARYTSPHLVSLNERFFIDGLPVADSLLESASQRVSECARELEDVTFFEALTAAAFVIFAESRCRHVVLETGLGGRLDATNICQPAISVITRIGLDHCDWLGSTLKEVAAEKAGIIKPGVPVVLGSNDGEVRELVAARAAELGAPFHYAPDIASAAEIPGDFSLAGSFNRENAVTAIAAYRILFGVSPERGFGDIVWPGRFQKKDGFIIDGAHNPPACRALVAALKEEIPALEREKVDLIAGFCGDKDVDEVLRLLSPYVRRAFAVGIRNPRSLTAGTTAAKMRASGMDAAECSSLAQALALADPSRRTLVCGSLFLAGEALAELGAYPWPHRRVDANESVVSG